MEAVLEKPANPHVVPQRSVDCRVLTPAGWLLGTLRMPAGERILSYLNRMEPFLRLTQVVLPHRAAPIPFFAVGRDNTLLLAPTTAGDVAELKEHAGSVTHHTSWLLPGGVLLDGQMDLSPGERVSDHLLARTGFVVVSDCDILFPHGGTSNPGEFAFDVVVLQAACAVGVTEVTGPA